MADMTREELTPVDSSNIEAVGYRDRVLYVQFRNGGFYRYADVSPQTHEALLAAPSKGTFLHKLIVRNPAHPCARMDAEQVQK